MARRTAAEAAQTRQDILAAARRLFAERGYTHVSVPDISRSIGLTHGALYHHFDSKDELFRAVFDQVEQELNEKVITTALTEGSAWESFVAGTRAVITGMKDPEFQQIALTDAPAVFGWGEWHAVDTGIGMTTLLGGLEMLQADGYLVGADLTPLSMLLFGGMTEAGMQLARDGSDDEIERFVATICQVILAMSPGRDA